MEKLYRYMFNAKSFWLKYNSTSIEHLPNSVTSIDAKRFESNRKYSSLAKSENVSALNLLNILLNTNGYK